MSNNKAMWYLISFNDYQLLLPSKILIQLYNKVGIVIVFHLQIKEIYINLHLLEDCKHF